ncbi:MAG: YdiU family protein [Deltaproteobacteria bacterium]|nr:YdiU family protein [Deltaproteobacteria bacterium]
MDNALGLEHTYAAALEGLYAPIDPAGFPQPALLLLNRPLATALGLDPAWLEAHGAAVLSGSAVLEGTRPLAQAYAGHQFGHFNPRLGDGRALLIGEVVDPAGHRFDLHLKGAGTTPFSRQGDGRAALDSALREYIVSEAMHALGIPTTRSLAVVTTGETILRQRAAPGAVLTRVAASHLRIGTLELFASLDDRDALQRLVQYSLQRHYPERAHGGAVALLEAVASAQARLIARWMAVGFVHGVMNTDNVALSGETIDFGPCAFMDAYDPDTVFSQIDQQGRYRFGHQPGIGAWNMARMAEALLELLADDRQAAIELGQATLDRFQSELRATWLDLMRAKLGLPGAEDDDGALIQALLDAMARARADYTLTFRRLADGLEHETQPDLHPEIRAWLPRWRARLGASAPKQMNQVNPLYIPRNHKVEEALSAALAGDLGPTTRLLEVLARPFEAQPGCEAYAEPAPESFGCYQTHCNT